MLVGEAFANAHHLKPGDALWAVLNGRREQLRIVGVAISPEYIFQIKPGDLFPDDRRFGVFWMSRAQLAAAWNLEGAFNNITLTWMRGANEKELIRRLDLLTAPYGGAGAGGRDEQLSHRYLSDEMVQLRVMGTVAPSIFLGVAAFLLNIVASRVIAMQREQVAALKAFGFTHREVATHYLKLVMVIAALGIVLGVAVGAKLGQGLTAMYAEFYHFPVFYFQLHWPVIIWGALIGGGAAAVGAWTAVARVARLPAAEAMRAEPPGNFGPTLIERIGLARWLPLTARMIARQLERRPWKSVLSMVGIGLAVAVLILGNFAHDALQYLIDVQFFRAARRCDRGFLRTHFLSSGARAIPAPWRTALRIAAFGRRQDSLWPRLPIDVRAGTAAGSAAAQALERTTRRTGSALGRIGALDQVRRGFLGPAWAIS